MSLVGRGFWCLVSIVWAWLWVYCEYSVGEALGV